MIILWLIYSFTKLFSVKCSKTINSPNILPPNFLAIQYIDLHLLHHSKSKIQAKAHFKLHNFLSSTCCNVIITNISITLKLSNLNLFQPQDIIIHKKSLCNVSLKTCDVLCPSQATAATSY